MNTFKTNDKYEDLNQEELDKLYEYGFDGIDWEHGGDYGETTHEILDEEKNDESNE